MDERSYDVVVVGGGAAGLSAALTLARARRRVLVVDAGEPRNATAGHVHGYLGREGAPPGQLLAAGREEVRSYGGEVVDGTATGAVALDGPEASFRVGLADGGAVRARRLLVATGLVDELPDVPGLAQRWGRDVLHCPYCHGWEVRDRAIGVLASGPLAVHQALLFRQWSADVVLLRHTGPAPDADQAARLAARGVPVLDGEVVAVETAGDRLTGVRLADGQVVPLEALVVGPVVRARSRLLEQLGAVAAPLEVSGTAVGWSVPADARGATSVPGVWVAGNVTDLKAQVVVAAAAGVLVAAQLNADLVEEDVRQALAAVPAG